MIDLGLFIIKMEVYDRQFKLYDKFHLKFIKEKTTLLLIHSLKITNLGFINKINFFNDLLLAILLINLNF